jgi:hypothetical protein
MIDMTLPGPIGSVQRSLARWLDLSAPVPAEHSRLMGRLDQAVRRAPGEYKFEIGQAVQFSPTCARGVPGLYVVTGQLPVRDGEFEYCIDQDAEPYPRIAKESELR